MKRLFILLVAFAMMFVASPVLAVDWNIVDSEVGRWSDLNMSWNWNYTIGNPIYEYSIKRVTNPEALNQTISVICNLDGKNVSDKKYMMRGYIGTMAKGKETSVKAFKLLLLVANKMGSNTVHVTRQGVDYSVYAKGWGASLGGVTGSIDDPWIQGIALEPIAK